MPLFGSRKVPFRPVGPFQDGVDHRMRRARGDDHDRGGLGGGHLGLTLAAIPWEKRRGNWGLQGPRQGYAALHPLSFCASASILSPPGRLRPRPDQTPKGEPESHLLWKKSR